MSLVRKAPGFTILVGVLFGALLLFFVGPSFAQNEGDTEQIRDLLAPETDIPATFGGSANGPTGTVSDTAATFNFSSSETPATYECRMDLNAAPDGTPWQSCTSPKTYTGLSVQSHTFEVRATDDSAAPNTDQTPAFRTWTIGSSSGNACPSGATNITTAQNLGQIVTNGSNSSTAQTFCVLDGTHTLSQTAEMGTNDQLIGDYSDSSRPQINAGAGVHDVVDVEGANNVHIEAVVLADAKADFTNPPTNTVCSTASGRGISRGGSNLTVENVRMADNANNGAGGLGPNATFTNVVAEGNGYETCYWNSGTTARAAGIKTTEKLTVTESVITENEWNGVWCDLRCVQFEVQNNRIQDNGKAGVAYEASPVLELPCPTPNPTSTDYGAWSDVSGNTIQGNGWRQTNRQEAEILGNSSSCILIHDNTFGDTGNHVVNGANFNPEGRVYAVWWRDDKDCPPGSPDSPDWRCPGTDETTVRVYNDNILNSDQYDCENGGIDNPPGITCPRTSPWPF